MEGVDPERRPSGALGRVAVAVREYELEAVDPPELRRMIDDALAETWSAPAHAAVLAREREERDQLVADLTRALGAD